jgi:hypothetical protein
VDISKISDSQNPDVEGLDYSEDSSLGDYPIDTLLIRNENRTVHDVLRRITKGSFVMDPDFQRDFIWPEDKQCKLIESVVMRIPLPVFYLAEDHDGRMIVVDGLQRLSTFQRFVNGDFKLKLKDQAELNNKYFDDLSPKLQNRIEDCNLVLYIIDAKVPDQALLDIFERVNSGIPLTRQQMRNCLYTGKASRFLKEEASSGIFLKATGKSLNTKIMRDRELVNRFCAFQILGPEKYNGEMDEFLALALKKMNQMSDSELNNLSQQFRKSLQSSYKVFTKHAFRKHSHPGDKRSVINASLWDVISTGLSRYPENLVESKAGQIHKAFFELMNDNFFNDSISLGTSQVNRVHTRFKIFNQMLKDVLGD